MRFVAVKPVALSPYAGARRDAGGFTLVELIIAVAIVSILAAIAIPSYASYIQRGNRTAVKAMLAEIVQRQESFAVDHKVYTTNLASLGYPGANLLRDGRLSTSTTDAIYQISVSGTMSATCGTSGVAGRTVALVAKPLNSQLKDSCGTLCLNSVGTRGTSSDSGSSAAVQNCWGR